MKSYFLFVAFGLAIQQQEKSISHAQHEKLALLPIFPAQELISETHSPL